MNTIRYTTKTKTVLFTISGMNGVWSRWRNNRQAAAEASHAAVKEARIATPTNTKISHAANSQ